MIRRASVLSVLLLVLTSTSVSALEQEMFVFDDVRSGTTSICGFPVTVDRVGTLRIILLTDDSGAEVREIEQYARYKFTFTNPATGQSVVGYSSGVHIASDVTRTAESLTFQLATSGGLVRVNVPGGGVIAGFMGHRLEHVTLTRTSASFVLLEESGFFEPRTNICPYLTP